MNRTARAVVERLAALPAGKAIGDFVSAQPRRAAWLALWTATCTILIVAGRDAGLPLRSWLALFGVAALVCEGCLRIAAGGTVDALQDRSTADLKDSPGGNAPA